MTKTLTFRGTKFRCASMRRYILVREHIVDGATKIEILKRSDTAATVRHERYRRSGSGIIDTVTGAEII
jgi:hypothetical protein